MLGKPRIFAVIVLAAAWTNGFAWLASASAHIGFTVTASDVLTDIGSSGFGVGDSSIFVSASADATDNSSSGEVESDTATLYLENDTSGIVDITWQAVSDVDASTSAGPGDGSCNADASVAFSLGNLGLSVSVYGGGSLGNAASDSGSLSLAPGDTWFVQGYIICSAEATSGPDNGGGGGGGPPTPEPAPITVLAAGMGFVYIRRRKIR